jgi:transcriptional accessory protein Tex/SPT6
MDNKFIGHFINRQTGRQATDAAAMIAEEATVSFIARYRKTD